METTGAGCSASSNSSTPSLDALLPPPCGVCLDTLGSNGGPASLPCGHNGCLECLNQVLDAGSTGSRQQAQCPFCRQPYEARIPLSQNLELKHALEALQQARTEVASAQQELVVQHQKERQQQAILLQHQQQLLAQHQQQKGHFSESPPKEGLYPPVPVQYSAQGQERDNRACAENPDAGGSRTKKMLRGVLSLVNGRSRSRDQFWNTAAAAASNRDGGEASSGANRAGQPYGDAADGGLARGGVLLAPPSAPPLSFSGDPHYLTGLSAVDRFLDNVLGQRGISGEEAAGLSAVQRVLEAEPPTWVPDSSSPTCMRCSNAFRPVLCTRHHCRFCGHLVCDACSRGRALLPKLFRESEPQRVCDGCFEVLLPVQRMLVATVSPAVQVALHDVTDWSSVRAWVNSPWGRNMQDEIYKASNTLRAYSQVGRLNPEKAIPGVVLGGARGLALLTIVKAGAGVAYKLGSGLVLSRRPDGSWSAPTAIATAGFGWGAQIGGEILDLIVVLRSLEALKAFCGDYHVAVGASVGAAAGPVGRVVEADVRAGRRGLSTAYTYSCSKGAYVGVSWEYSIIAACHNTNMKFYGSRDCRPADILFGNFPQPMAAQPLYAALQDLFEAVDAQHEEQQMEQQEQHLQQQQQQRALPGPEPYSQPRESRFEVGDAMAAAEAVASGALAGACRFFGDGDRDAAEEGGMRRPGLPQHVPQHLHADDAVLGPPPPPYDACYPGAGSYSSNDAASEWSNDALPTMMPS